MYLTTPIYYVNDVPHLGHAYTTVLADALVRWERQRGRPARLVTGTDEHGLKVARAAVAAGVSPAALAEDTAAGFRSAWAGLSIGYDAFVRTTSAEHTAVVPRLLRTVYDRGHVELGRYDGRYCVPCEAYLSAGSCPIHRRPTEHVVEENYFFRLSAFAPALSSWLAESDAVRPRSRRNEALGLLRAGLADFSISRPSLDWGIPLPWDPKHVTYVWVDALAGYLTGAGWGSADFGAWWPPHHLIGKDILRFHAIYWPALLLAAELPLPSRITVHGFLLARGEKIAKSGLSGVPLDELVAAYGADGVRYHLLRSYPVGPDGDFSLGALAARYRSDLANTLGNLVSRLAALVAAKSGGIGPAVPPDSALAEPAANATGDAVAGWDGGQPAEALTAVWRLAAAANSALVAAEPWRLPVGSAAVERVLGEALEAVRLVAVLASPAIPQAAEAILHRIGATGSTDLAWGGYPGGQRVVKDPPLFPRQR